MISSPLGELSPKTVDAASLQGNRAGTGINAVAVAVAALGALYLLQAYSPMRLDNDSVVYLHMATNIADGLPVDSRGLPPGYPAMIALLDKVGLGRAFVFTLMNCAFFALGLACTQWVFRKNNGERMTWVVPLTMLSFVLIRWVPLPGPESMFLGVSMAAVVAMSSAVSGVGKRRLMFLTAAVVLTLIAITVRLVGFALVPALLSSCFHSDRSEARKSIAWTRAGKWLAAAAITGVAIVGLLVLTASLRKYSSEAALGYTLHGAAGLLVGHVKGLLRTIGMLTINVPWTQFPAFLPLFVWAGLATITLIVSTVRLRLPRTPAGVYLLSFLLLLLIWPYNALRLWLPIVPLLIGYLQCAQLRIETGRKWKFFMTAYYTWFAFAAAGALAYTTRITLSGKDFPKVYGKAGGMSAPDPKTGRIDTEHNERARQLQSRYGNPF